MRHVHFSNPGAFLSMFGLARNVWADSQQRAVLQRIGNARVVFNQILNDPHSTIPQELLESATCVAIFPGGRKFAFLARGQCGKGLVTCRTSQGWSAPAFLTAIGSTPGLQVGDSSKDLIMVFRNRKGIRRLLDNTFKIGADVTAVAGPVGRHTAAAANLKTYAEVVTYSRSRGVLAGASLDGTVIEPDRSADRAIYGSNVRRKAVLSGKISAPGAAQGLLAEIARAYTVENPERVPKDEERGRKNRKACRTLTGNPAENRKGSREIAEEIVVMKATWAQVDGVTVVDLKGRIVHGDGAVQLRETVGKLTRTGRNHILLNLEDVTQIDCAGLGELVRLYMKLHSQGGDLKLLNPGKRIQELLRITKLNTVLEVSQDEVGAFAALNAVPDLG